MTSKKIRLSSLPYLNKWFAMKNLTENMVSSVRWWDPCDT